MTQDIEKSFKSSQAKRDYMKVYYEKNRDRYLEYFKEYDRARRKKKKADKISIEDFLGTLRFLVKVSRLPQEDLEKYLSKEGLERFNQ